MEYSKVVQMLTIATDFDNVVIDHELKLPLLNMNTADECYRKLHNFSKSEILQNLRDWIREYQAIGKSFG